jgi:hypothetical protein
MADPAALADLDRRIQIVEGNLRELIEQAAAYPVRRTKTALRIASPTSKRSSTRCSRSARLCPRNARPRHALLLSFDSGKHRQAAKATR